MKCQMTFDFLRLHRFISTDITICNRISVLKMEEEEAIWSGTWQRDIYIYYCDFYKIHVHVLFHV